VKTRIGCLIFRSPVDEEFGKRKRLRSAQSISPQLSCEYLGFRQVKICDRFRRVGMLLCGGLLARISKPEGHIFWISSMDPFIGAKKDRPKAVLVLNLRLIFRRSLRELDQASNLPPERRWYLVA
jgi:hypothetical protein